jgi:hypothetical protein
MPYFPLHFLLFDDVNTVKNLEGSRHGLVEVFPRHLPEGAEENHGKPVRFSLMEF